MSITWRIMFPGMTKIVQEIIFFKKLVIFHHSHMIDEWKI